MRLHPPLLFLELLLLSLLLYTCATPAEMPTVSSEKIVVRKPDTISTDGRIQLRRFPADTVFTAAFPLLAKTAYPAEVYIQGSAVTQYSTGIFFKDLTFAPGINRVELAATFPDGTTASYKRDIYYVPRVAETPVFPLWIDTATIYPKQAWQGLPSDQLRISFQGSKGQQGMLEIHPGGLQIPMARTDLAGFSRYEAAIPMERLRTGKQYRAVLVLQGGGKTYKLPLANAFHTQHPWEYPILKTTRNKAPLSYNLGPIRLGGPLIGEYPAGILFQATGKIEGYYRVQLAPDVEGYFPSDAVEALPLNTLKPQYFIQSIRVAPSDSADVLRIPYLEPVPYTVQVDPSARSMMITLYGVQTSSTWMSHYANLRMIDHVTWEQPAKETYQLKIQLKAPFSWGYTVQPEGKSLVLRVSYPPALAVAPEQKSWKGLKISIEAGHGGWNTGAEGLSGILEKDVNLDVSLRLEARCKQAGIEVLQIRPTDQYMTLEAKRTAAEAFRPHLHVSIHSNSSGGGYLGANGVSTYYNNPLWEPFARTVYKALLDLPLKEFGVVGSFNYHVTRMHSQPSILVELAFLSHALDEAKLASPDFRQQLADAIFSGIEAYLNKSLLDSGTH